MAKEKDTRRPDVGAEQPAKRNRRGGSSKSPGEQPMSGSGGEAAAQKSDRRKTADDRERRVRDRAYEIWDQEGRPSGREREHWEQAERES